MLALRSIYNFDRSSYDLSGIKLISMKTILHRKIKFNKSVKNIHTRQKRNKGRIRTLVSKKVLKYLQPEALEESAYVWKGNIKKIQRKNISIKIKKENKENFHSQFMVS